MVIPYGKRHTWSSFRRSVWIPQLQIPRSSDPLIPVTPATSFIPFQHIPFSLAWQYEADSIILMSRHHNTKCCHSNNLKRNSTDCMRHLGKLTVAKLVKKSPSHLFKEPDASLSCSQAPLMGPVHQPLEATPCTQNLHTGLFKMNVGVVTTCHTQYTSFSRCNSMWYISMGVYQESVWIRKIN